MGELEFQRKLTDGSGAQPIGERERAEGESAGDSDPSDNEADQDQEGSDSDEDIEAKGRNEIVEINKKRFYLAFFGQREPCSAIQRRKTLRSLFSANKAFLYC